MIEWALFALLTLAVLAGLLWPLLATSSKPPDRLVHDLAVYRDQLAEIEREAARGLLSGPELAAARLEIERRILAADGAARTAATAPRGAPRWVTALALAVALPMAAFGLYLLVGSPGLPDQPLAGRLNDPDVKMARLADQLADRLAKTPDAKGYALLAGVLADLGRYGDARAAYGRAQALGDDTAATWSALGQIVVMANGGGVVPEARSDFLHALQRDPDEPRSRFYIGLAEAQIGNAAKALAIWRDLEASAPPESPWLPLVRDNIQTLAKETGIDPASVAPDRSDIVRQLQTLGDKG